MPDDLKDAKLSDSSNDKDGAKDGGSPTPEALKAAQDAAEKYRKEAEETKEALEEKEAELEALNEKAKLSETEKRRKALLEAGIEDDEALIAELNAEAKSGKRWAQAVKAEIRKTARELAQEEIKKVLSERDLERDFEARDEWLEDMAEKRQVSVKEFKALIGEHADQSLKGSPKKQAKTAYLKFLEHEKFQKEKAELDAAKRESQGYRDGGTSGADKGGEKIDFTKDWRKAKTEREKEMALHDI